MHWRRILRRKDGQAGGGGSPCILNTASLGRNRIPTRCAGRVRSGGRRPVPLGRLCGREWGRFRLRFVPSGGGGLRPGLNETKRKNETQRIRVLRGGTSPISWNELHAAQRYG